MTAFDKVLSDIFDRRADRGKLPLEEERAAIEAVKTGDDAALEKLLYAYAYTLREAVKWQTRALPAGAHRSELEEVRSQAVMGFMEAIHKFDPSRMERLAAIAPQYVRGAVSDAAQAITRFTVPQRTLTRFLGILREADNNEFVAAGLAPQYEMSTETFLAVLSAVRKVDSLDVLTAGRDDASGTGGYVEEAGWTRVDASPTWDGTQADVEDQILVEAAFRAVDDLEADVCRLSYGFTDYEPIPDAEVAHLLGLSRQKVQRTRSAALAKMRNALGVA